ncbi:winged helix-turn-helix domain-containing protein [Streptomyces sp. NPDC008238]
MREQRRLTAGQFFEQGGRSDAEIARLLGVSAQAVHNWHHAWNQGGSEALLGHGIAGAQCALDENQRQELRELLRAGAKDYSFATDGWTLARVRRVIIERFSVVYGSLSGVSRLLHHMGFTPQVPARQAAERDADAIQEWVETQWPEIAKGGPPEPGSVSRTRPEPR